MKKKYTKLFLIGNGFDRWQGLPTSYGQFKEYYKTNIQRIAKELRVKSFINEYGILITPVEMIFGDISKPSSLAEDFFWNLETSMALLDDQKILDYFPKSNKGVSKMQKTVEKAQELLQRVFSEWIESIEIETKDSGYRFGDGCYFVNFNYTDTLEKRFGVDETDDYHIHGEASDPDTIIVGHSTHPEMAFPELIEQKMIRTFDGKKSKRLQGLFLIEQALYETDKHIQDNIDDACEFLSLDGVHIEEITDVYVLGHSFAEVDYEYLEFFVKATQKGTDLNKLSALWKIREIGMENFDEEKLLEAIQYNVLYATQHRKRVLEKENIRFPKAEAIETLLFGQTDVYTDSQGIVHKCDESDEKAKAAVYQRFLLEQACRTKETIDEFCLLKGIHELPSECYSILKAAEYIDGGHSSRCEDAKWHISYFSDADKERIINTMKTIGFTNYELYHGIDDCIKEFKV